MECGTRRADLLEESAREALDAISSTILQWSDRQVFHIVGAANAHAGVKEVITIAFDGETVARDGGDGKENEDYMDTHAASAKLIRAIVECEVTQSQVPRLMVVVEHQEGDRVDGATMSVLRHNPANKAAGSRVLIRVARQGASEETSAPQQDVPSSKSSIFLCTNPLVLAK